MLYDLAPPVDETSGQRENDTSSASPRLSSPPLGRDLPLHCITPPEEVSKWYPPPPMAAWRPSLPHPPQGEPHAVQMALSKPTPKRPRSPPTNTSPPSSHNAPHALPRVHFEADFSPTDYLGRSFLHPPPDLSVSPIRCRPPRALRGVWGRHDGGVQQLRLSPQSGHLLLAADLQGEVRLYAARPARRLATFVAHTRPIKSLEMTTHAVMSSASLDGTVALWDLELGTQRGVLTNPEGLPCVQHVHHPHNDDALVLAALDRKVVLYDVRVSQARYQREYTGHMGTIFNLTLLSDGGKLLTTAEDKTLRTWDFRVPVQIKQIADVSMHAITHVVHHPTEAMLVAQSLNNQVLVFADGGGGQVKLLRHRVFSGHTVSGTSCQLAFSPDGRYLSSGDINGKLFIWSWETGELVRSFPAHTQTLVSHQWSPAEASRVITSAWDGSIKSWS